MRAPLKISLVCLLAILPARVPAQSTNLLQLMRSFQHPPDDSRIMMRWWWFGPAVTKPELEREMKLMKDGGIGGFEVQPVYPLTLEGNFNYLSPEFLDDLQFAGAKARELGLRMDLTLGSGWPYGGPHISVSKASSRLRVERSAPKLADGESLIALVDGQYFIASRTRQTVKRPAIGAEGFVLDHYNRSSLDAHLKTVGEPMLKALANTPPYAIFSDSLEVYNADWTPDFLQEFQKRRGYDLTPFLPALNGDIGERTAAIRHDWGRTLTELLDDYYLVPLHEWAQNHNTLLRSQTYGTPPASLSSNALVDLPEGEGSDWRQFSMTRWASSASHLYNRPVTSSETWTWLNSPAFRATPLDMKAEGDRHFLEGINQLIGHGWPYSPPSAGEPGWRFYAAAVFNEHNPWWIVMPEITAYLQRVSFLLRQGRPVNDVALYLPTDDAYASFTMGNVFLNQAMGKLLGPTLIPAILDAGYNLDFIDDEAIARMGVPYPVLILPNIERIPLSTYQKIEDYARKGGTVIAIGRPPSLAPGLREAERETPGIRELSRKLFSSKGILIQNESQLSEALHRAKTPDAVLPPEVGYVHRKLDSVDIYFLANTSNHPVRGPATFRDARRSSQWWNPLDGGPGQPAGRPIQLDLAPYESRFLVFFDQGPADPNLPSRKEAFPQIDLSSGWSVTFPGSEPIAMTKLQSWTDLPARKYFSGAAVYEKVVNIESSLLLPRREVYLNFGEGATVTTAERRSGNGMRAMLEGPVREAAVVYVNGKRAGSIWHPPYEIAVGTLLHAGENSLRIVVANLAINRLAEGPLPDYRELNARFGERFQQQDMANLQPLPSGLLGPVRLIPR